MYGIRKGVKGENPSSIRPRTARLLLEESMREGRNADSSDGPVQCGRTAGLGEGEGGRFLGLGAIAIRRSTVLAQVDKQLLS